jgi:hypothetical protein
MFRKLVGIGMKLMSMDARPVVAALAISYGMKKLMDYQADRQEYLNGLNEQITQAEARWADLSEQMSASAHLREPEPYPAPEDLNPLGTVELDLAVAPA